LANGLFVNTDLGGNRSIGFLRMRRYGIGGPLFGRDIGFSAIT
jgi:hypothetical protein